jgi:RNA polymerase sigma-70 factor (ECF subfamily)
VAARRPRGAASATEARQVVEAFQRALKTGDLKSLLDVLAPDVVLLSDGGGVAQAALAPVQGAATVAELLGRIAPAAALQLAQLNGHPALIIRLNERIDTVIAMRFDHGAISGLYAVRNPEKLLHLERETALRRCVG